VKILFVLLFLVSCNKNNEHSDFDKHFNYVVNTPIGVFQCDESMHVDEQIHLFNCKNILSEEWVSTVLNATNVVVIPQ
jgi:hypothetical protein